MVFLVLVAVVHIGTGWDEDDLRGALTRALFRREQALKKASDAPSRQRAR